MKASVPHFFYRFRIDKNYLNIPYNVCPIDEEGLIGYLKIIYEQTNNIELL
jgi:hypothetical protein